MKKTINTTHIEGLIYEHALESRVTGENSKNPGTPFIMGTLSIATDNACQNIVPVHFTYVTATTSSGKNNATYGILSDIINGKLKTIMDSSKDEAAKVRIDSAIGLNEFYSERNGAEELVSVKRNEGGFVHKVDVLATDENTRNTFKCDMIITSVIEVEETDTQPARAIVKGTTFDFRNELLPIELTATNKGAIDYFLSLDASPAQPVFTQVWGKQISQTVVTTITQETAFGDPYVQEVTRSRKDWVITGASPDPYDWDSEETITAAELKDLMAKRETNLAAIKQRQDEYKASKASAAAPANKGTSSGGFNF